MTSQTYSLARVSPGDRALMWAGAAIALLLLALPLFGMWNLLAGYAGLVSVGQQAFIGLSGYFVLRLVEAGTPPFVALVLGAMLVIVVAWPLSWFVLRLKAAEFAVAMWVIAEAFRSIVMFDPLVQGETGRSLVTLNAIDADLRRTVIYLIAVASACGAMLLSYFLLRGQIGAESQAIRDDEEAAGSVGVSTMRVKRWIFLISAVGCALAGTMGSTGRCSCCSWCWSAAWVATSAPSSAHCCFLPYKSYSVISGLGISLVSVSLPFCSRSMPRAG